MDVLNVPKQKRQDPEYLLQILETAVDEFFQDLSGHMPTGLALSKHTLAMLALYHRILMVWKTKGRGPMFLGPIFRMLANSEGTSRKQYLPEDQGVKMSNWQQTGCLRTGRDCRKLLNGLSMTCPYQ